MPFYSYVLLSQKNGTLYKGSTDNIQKRIETHNAGKVKYSSKHLPWKLVISEEFVSRAEAMKREKWYKTGVGRDWINNQLKNSSVG
jgi:putative endonuclease